MSEILTAKDYKLDLGYSQLMFRCIHRELAKEDYYQVLKYCLDLVRCRGYILYEDQKKVQDFFEQLKLESEVIKNGN